MLSRLVFWLWLVSFEGVRSDLCSLCPDGQEIDPLFGPKPIGLTQPLPIEDCQALVSLLQLIPEENDLCVQSRFLSTYCGCPLSSLNSSGYCSICRNASTCSTNSSVLDISSSTASMTITDIMSSPSLNLGGLVELPPSFSDESLTFGLDVTCDLVESAMNTAAPDDPDCLALPYDKLQDLCGCYSQNTMANATNTDGTNDDRGSANTTCPFCTGSEQLPFLPKNKQVVYSPTGESLSCLTLHEMASSITPNNTECRTIQQHSFLCGCPETNSACRLCSNGATMRNSETDITDLVLSSFSTSEEDHPKQLSCETYDAKLTTLPNDNDRCRVTDEIQQACDCSRPCTLCPLGEPVPHPQRDISYHLENLGNFLGLQELGDQTCGVLESAFSVISTQGDSTCGVIQMLGKLCGCQPPENSCDIFGGRNMTLPNNKAIASYGHFGAEFSEFSQDIESDISWQEALTGQPLSCALLDSAFSALIDQDFWTCFTMKMLKSEFCGAGRDPHAETLLWCQRIFASLSFLGSLILFTYVLVFERKAQRWSVYNQIVCGISVFDMFSSFALALTTIPVPVEYGFPRSFGNQATCRLQGFLIQLGQTSIYYNVALSAYFLAVIKYGYTERKCAKVLKWVHLALNVFGLALASASIPFHLPNYRWCYVHTVPLAPSYLQAIVFLILPVSLSIIFITVFTAKMVWYVRSKERKTKQVSVRRSAQQRTLFMRAFWQSILYIATFYLVWPIFIVSFMSRPTESNFWFFVVAGIISPSQGLWNAVIFFRRKRGALRGVFFSLWERIWPIGTPPNTLSESPSSNRATSLWNKSKSNRFGIHDHDDGDDNFIFEAEDDEDSKDSGVSGLPNIDGADQRGETQHAARDPEEPVAS